MLTTTSPQIIDLQVKLFRGFSDPSRLCILEVLRDGPLTVSAIVEATELTQTNVSNHLGCLRECGLVTAKPKGRFVSYQLSDKRVGKFLLLAEELLSDVAKGVYECTRFNRMKRTKHEKK